MSAATKVACWLPITSISMEQVKFDIQLLQNPEISGVEYQQGELFGREVREYLLERRGRRCASCGKEGMPLEVEHVVPWNPKCGPKGTNRICNLTLACKECNRAKGNLQPHEWLEQLKRSRQKIDRIRAEHLPEVLKQVKVPLKDAAFMNATRWALSHRLLSLGLPVGCGAGARTKKQRLERGLLKEHYYDACCVGASRPEKIVIAQRDAPVWSAVGRETRKMCNTDAHGFPVGHRERQKRHFGLQTGDMVVADVPMGKDAGRWIGRVAVRASGCFDSKDSSGKRLCQGISHRHIKLLQQADGWQYEKKTTAS